MIYRKRLRLGALSQEPDVPPQGAMIAPDTVIMEDWSTPTRAASPFTFFQPSDIVLLAGVALALYFLLRKA